MIRRPPRSTLFSLHDALPISWSSVEHRSTGAARRSVASSPLDLFLMIRSEEHTSELQSRSDLVCRLLLEKKKKHILSCNRRMYPCERPILIISFASRAFWLAL